MTNFSNTLNNTYTINEYSGSLIKKDDKITKQIHSTQRHVNYKQLINIIFIISSCYTL